MQKASGKAVCDYSFHCIITDIGGAQLDEMNAVIFDPRRKHTISAKTHHVRVDYSMFEGTEVTGMPQIVLSRGQVVVDDDKFLGSAGAGEFLKRSTYSQP
jgi:dihydropyrimidinase